MCRRVHGLYSEGQGQGILPGYLKPDSQCYTRTCQIPNYMYIYFSHFLLGLQWNDNKTKSQGIGKNMSDILGFHIQVIFHIFYRYMGKEYHYFVIILKYIFSQFYYAVLQKLMKALLVVHYVLQVTWLYTCFMEFCLKTCIFSLNVFFCIQNTSKSLCQWKNQYNMLLWWQFKRFAQLFFCFLFCCINLLTPRPRYAETIIFIIIILFILTLESVGKIVQ